MEVLNNLKSIIAKHKDNMPVIVVAELLAEIDEAEADCCEWKEMIVNKERLYKNCKFDVSSIPPHTFTFCPYCGRRIKINEADI